MARGAPRLVMVQFEDLLPEAQQVNLPGTYDEHPNWRRRLPVLLEDLRSCHALTVLAEIMASAGRRP